MHTDGRRRSRECARNLENGKFVHGIAPTIGNEYDIIVARLHAAPFPTRFLPEASNAVRLTVIVAVVVLIIGVIALFRAQRMNRASIERDGLSRFRDAFRGRYPELLLAQVYAYLAERHGVVEPHYIVNPTDNLEREHGLVDLDLEDAVLVIADRAGARLPRANELDELKVKVRSVDDLLRYLEPFFRPEVVKG